MDFEAGILVKHGMFPCDMYESKEVKENMKGDCENRMPGFSK